MKLFHLPSLTLAALVFSASLCLAESHSITVNYYTASGYHSVSGFKQDSTYILNDSGKRTVKLATLDWPPYIGDKLCDKGWVFQLAVALLASKDYRLEIEFLPWARAVRMVEAGQMDILFPEYFIEEAAPSDHFPTTRRDLLALSDKFPGGPIGFMKRRGEIDEFEGNLENLIGARIGVVRGYQNTPEFDAMMDNNLFDITETIDDLQLVKVLAAKRVDLIIGDPDVLRFSVNYSSLSKAEKFLLLNEIEEVKPHLLYNHLYFAISKQRDNWQQLQADINSALGEFELHGETLRINRNKHQCSTTPNP